MPRNIGCLYSLETFQFYISSEYYIVSLRVMKDNANVCFNSVS